MTSRKSEGESTVKEDLGQTREFRSNPMGGLPKGSGTQNVDSDVNGGQNIHNYPNRDKVESHLTITVLLLGPARSEHVCETRRLSVFFFTLFLLPYTRKRHNRDV